MSQRAINIVGHIVGVIGALCFVLSISAGLSSVTQSTAVASTPRGIVAPTATLDPTQVDDQRSTQVGTTPRGQVIYACDTDTDCVTKNPRVIPDADTVTAYWQVWGSTPLFPVTGDCSHVNWTEKTADGSYYVPTDVNNDGVIDCGSDIELGA